MNIKQMRIQALKALMGGKTQKEFADLHNLDASYISQLLNGHRDMGEKAAETLEGKIGLPPGTLVSPTGGEPMPAKVAVEANAELLGEMDVWEDGDPLDEDDCEVPYYAEVEFAGGAGMTEVVEVADRKLRFSNATLRAAGVDRKSAAVARVKGRSMERLILDGAAIGFDLSDTTIIDGEIYAFNQGGMLRAKYLHRLPGGAVRIRSENDDEYPDEIMTAEQYLHEVKMLGRVFWWSTVRRSPRRRS
ncbi:helix-turn-helix transcriptional regulator [Pseudomonas sp. GV071]|uniref:LexA family transcriptional regulator n=1 Tax=Pseudomonas sp. GV071 TaxID=2135754 RepID=UPI000D465C43|nr:helix-turn-helix transcriptional regulator [Pseudomonas sp. GV071]PTQ70300.1 phage repressor protein C with HTH and peptisase S24 domain [Pseudomonas sp. GV071]